MAPERSLPESTEDLRRWHAQAVRRRRLGLCLTALAGLALVYLVQTSGVATTGYDMQRYQTEHTEWQLRNEQLRLELAKRRSLAWVESQAIGQLGMQPPTLITYLREPAPVGTGG